MSESLHYRNEEWLYEKYWCEERSMCEIADMVDMDASNILYWMEKHGIERRSKSASTTLAEEKEFGDKKYRNKEWLMRKYIQEGLSSTEIAELADTSHRTILNWLDRFDIERRTPGEGSELNSLTGSEHPNWKPDTRSYGDGWNESKKNAVRDRDGNQCKYCGLSQDEHIEKYGMKLPVHHITPARLIDDPAERNSAENLETVCVKCHQKVEYMYPLRPTAEP